MRKLKVNSSSNMMPKKRGHLLGHFDITHNNIVTPNQRSLPKYKNIFNPKSGKSAKKEMGAKRNSQGKIGPNNRKENISPKHRPNRSNQKALRFE